MADTLDRLEALPVESLVSTQIAYPDDGYNHAICLTETELAALIRVARAAQEAVNMDRDSWWLEDLRTALDALNQP